jgi:hypothetical protein
MSVVAHEGSESTSMSHLLELNRELSNLGIEPDMHTGKRPLFFMNPVHRTEWMAGQLRRALQEGLGFEGGLEAAIDDQDMEMSGVRVAVFDPDSPRAKMAMFASILGMMAEKLDPYAD